MKVLKANSAVTDHNLNSEIHKLRQIMQVYLRFGRFIKYLQIKIQKFFLKLQFFTVKVTFGLRSASMHLTNPSG